MKLLFAAVMTAALAVPLAAGCASQPEVDARLYHANGEACAEGAKESRLAAQRPSDCRTKSGWRIARQNEEEKGRQGARQNQLRTTTTNNFAPEAPNPSS